jgi:RNA polymerase sigma-70 factor (ECF subfamily)
MEPDLCQSRGRSANSSAVVPMLADAADRQWFERELLAVLPHLLGTARRIARNSCDPEDLVADAVAKAWLHRESLKDPGRFRGWIFRILTNCFLEGCRTQAARPVEEPLGEGDEQFSLFDRLHQPFLLWWGNPEQEFLDRLLEEDLERAVEELPDAFRLPVILADLQGLTYAEIAEALAIPVGTVRSRLARGRGLLQKALWQYGRDAGLAGHSEPSPPGHL